MSVYKHYTYTSLSLFYLKVPFSQCYVLSDAYCRTKKYLLGLALGLPCVSYGWIKECIAKVGRQLPLPHSDSCCKMQSSRPPVIMTVYCLFCKFVMCVCTYTPIIIIIQVLLLMYVCVFDVDKIFPVYHRIVRCVISTDRGRWWITVSTCCQLD